MDWAQGYVTEIDYPYYYNKYLAPDWIRMALLLQGYAPPPVGAYLELGYGQGVSAAIHAAATNSPVWGTDFSPAQAAHAQGLAQAAHSGARFFEESFAEFAAREDLPEFSMVAMHGIWSWISADNRAVLIDLLRRKLLPGGVMYLGYNTFPGWAPMQPLRHLMSLHETQLGAKERGMVARVEDAMAFLRQLRDAGAGYFEVNPEVSAFLSRLEGLNKHYLAHEYFNQHWSPEYFTDIEQEFDAAKLQYAVSAAFYDRLLMFGKSEAARNLLEGLRHPGMRETVSDFILNRTFRHDLWLKGPRRLSKVEQFERLQQESFTLLTHKEDVPAKISEDNITLELNQDIHQPLLEALAADNYRSKSFAELIQQPAIAAIQIQGLIEALGVLINSRYVHAVQADAVIRQAAPRCWALNRELCERSRWSNNIDHLASPVTGCGIPVGRIQQLFLRAYQYVGGTPETWATSALHCLLDNNEHVLRDGEKIESEQESLSELTQQAQRFAEQLLPMLHRLGVVTPTQRPSPPAPPPQRSSQSAPPSTTAGYSTPDSSSLNASVGWDWVGHLPPSRK